MDLEYIRANIPCQWACPARTDIPGYIAAIHFGDYGQSRLINKRSNLFPGVLGRICSRPCEAKCRHGESDLGQPVGICRLKRVAADNAPRDFPMSEEMFTSTGKTVGIVGGGPGGLAAAHSLALFGHRVTVYEAMPKLGGMLLYGIPDFRVPPAVVENEVNNIVRMGVHVRTGVRLGVDVLLDELMGSHDALVLALGCYRSNRLGIRGEDLAGCESGLEFMMEVNEGRPPAVGRRVAVIGGGFTAMDCARSALRLGAEEVSVLVRRTEADLKAAKEEIVETRREGIRITGLTAPVEVVGTDRVEALRLIRTRIEAAPGGGKRPVPIEGSEFDMEFDTVIAAVGQKPERTAAWKGLPGEPSVDPLTGRTDIEGVFLAGDFLGGPSTVIEAIGQARATAVEVDEFLMGRVRRRAVVSVEYAGDTHRERSWDFIEREEMPTLAVPERIADGAAEVEKGLGVEEGATEARRCYLCNLRYTIHVPDCIYCRWCIDICPRDCIHLVSRVEGSGTLEKTSRWNEAAAIVIDGERCIRCGECLRVCPTRCIRVTRVRLTERLLPQEAGDV